MINRKGIESYIPEDEMTAVYRALERIDQECAEFFWVLCHTGLRLNEGVGLALYQVFKGGPKEKTLRKMLERFEIKSYLHLILDSQPIHGVAVRGKDGCVKRKPLKHRKRIEPKGSRLIPINDKRTTEILIKRFNRQVKLYKERAYGDDKGNYLLFDSMDKNRISNKMRKVYQQLALKAKSPHDCRHTFCTNMVAQTEGHTFLAKYVLGHSV